MVKIPFEHYEGCPATEVRMDRIESYPCSCKEWFDWENSEVEKKTPRLFRWMKRLRFKEIKVK